MVPLVLQDLSFLLSRAACVNIRPELPTQAGHEEMRAHRSQKIGTSKTGSLKVSDQECINCFRHAGDASTSAESALMAGKFLRHVEQIDTCIRDNTGNDNKRDYPEESTECT
jgi:hypothetical protein